MINAKNRIDTIPLLARIKANLIVFGVDFTDLNIFNDYPSINNYKVKKRTVTPISNQYQVFDESNDISIIPSEIILSNENRKSLVKLRYNSQSPFLLTVDGELIHLIEKTTNKVIKLKISLVEINDILSKFIVVNDFEYKIDNFIDIVGKDRISILTFDGCWNWNCGKPCQFCDMHPREKQYKSIKPTTNTIAEYKFDENQWWNDNKSIYIEGIKKSIKEIVDSNQIDPHMHILFMAGNLPSSNNVWKFTLEIIEEVSSIIELTKYDTYLNICPHTNEIDVKKLKKLGIKYLQYNIEVFGEQDYTEFCPGKIPYGNLISKFKEAVAILGKGNVRSNIVFGLQPLDIVLTGINDLASLGVTPDYSIFQPKKGTKLSNVQSPTLSEIFELNDRLSNIYKKNDFIPIYCCMSSRSSILNEIMNHH